MLKELAEKVLAESALTREEALTLTAVSGPDVFELFSHANRIRERFRGEKADPCSIISAKTGACPEDCSYCAQSASSKAEIETSSLSDLDTVLQSARRAKNQGAKRFCVVTSGKRVTDKELARIAEMVSGIRDLGLLPCATLGLLTSGELGMLKEAGLHRYHHNLETSERFFPRICGSHTYEDKLRTIRAVKGSGLSLCSGGIFGLGEDWEDRVDMALALGELGVDSVPINFLVPIKGTLLEGNDPLPPLEALKIVSLYRFMLPKKEIRICGGRLQTLGELNSMVFMAGADGLLTGDCLTTHGRRPEDDLKLVRDCGLRV
jgi:biotin synthase